MAGQRTVNASRGSKEARNCDAVAAAQPVSVARSPVDTRSVPEAHTMSRQTSTTSRSEKRIEKDDLHPSPVHQHQLCEPRVRYTKRGYMLEEAPYVNNLMWQVGLLELSNAMDFPANIWNQIPTPLFAAVLMGLGGSIAILWSIFAFWDMHKSLANVRSLRRERNFLKHWQHVMDDKDNLETQCLVQAWLDVNFRELGWESIDRVFMDLCCGISGVVVGTGALMAIRGDIDDVFTASNLLSGYIGNSLLAPFALMNTFWAIFMWKRAGGERKLLCKGKVLIDAQLQAKLRHHGRKHKLYALANGLTAIVGTVGSIMSSTLWYGYAVTAPAVFTSVFSNLFWRHRMGYDRWMVTCKQDLTDFDLVDTLQAIDTAMDAAANDTVHKLTIANAKTSQDIINVMAALGLQDALLIRLLNERRTDSTVPSVAWMQGLDLADVISAAEATTIAERKGILLHRERFLIEVYGRYLRALETAA